MRTGIPVLRSMLCFSALIAVSAANWIDPPPATESAKDARPAEASVSVPPKTAAEPRSQVAITPEFQTEGNPQSRASGGDSAIEVARWGFGNDLGDARKQGPQGNVVSSRPLYLWMTLEGTQAAVDRMRGGGLTIEVRWMRDDGYRVAGAPNLVTSLQIGHPGLIDTFAQQVRRNGFFEWHSWARKDRLGPGRWTVSLTYPDGQPLLCGENAQPCRFTIDVG
jgi:hypothetical protein